MATENRLRQQRKKGKVRFKVGQVVAIRIVNGWGFGQIADMRQQTINDEVVIGDCFVAGFGACDFVDLRPLTKREKGEREAGR